MLHLIPPPLHRLALRLAHALRQRWWRLTQPKIAGCRIMAFDGAGRLLLIRHSYGHSAWMLPGGGLKRDEDVLVAAARELREEAGCELHGAREVLAVHEALWGADNRVHIVAGSTTDEPRPDRREVTEAAFFALDSLPHDLASVLHRNLAEWLTATKAAGLPV